ncbi:hypothetical protein BE08_13640 [Sorangium cellulosum]|uniref:Uncharacterized protein n=1 Tax=Sorangium cellulosum TaxID=56 RepID=A0A150PR75_SORCE|nr:hypothetical protein BE08_13640 [Sorangium cellulosum]
MATGCMAPELAGADEPGDLGSSADALASWNALSANALSANALSANALSANALSANALSREAAATLEDPGEGGELFRTLVRYTVSCALDESQRFSFSWADAAGATHHEVYHGELGLADAWADGPLDEAGKQIVSACLAARTNRYGVSVVISMRSHQAPLRHEVGRDEREAYPHVEGAFWGNLFTEAPYLRACYNDASVEPARAARRDCAAGYAGAEGDLEGCGMIEIVGSCQDHCSKLHPPGKYHKDCVDPDSGKTRYVITTALR